MQRISAATATVALVSDDGASLERLRTLIADECTSLSVYPSFDALLASMMELAPDIVVIQDAVDHDACRQVRLLRRRIPSLHVIFVNVQDESRCIHLLHSGADDAIITDAPTRGARLQAAARRARTGNAAARTSLGDLVLDRHSRRVWCAGEEVPLTPHEYSVLNCLVANSPTPVSVDTLADFVWGDQELANRRSLAQVYMSYVRKKLSHSAQFIVTFARDGGYRLAPRSIAPQLPD